MCGTCNIRDVGCMRCGMFSIWDVWGVEYLGLGMCEMWVIQRVACLECGIFGMWDV